MKKIFLLFLLIPLVGCTKEEKKEIKEEKEEVTEKEEYVDDNPIKIGIYPSGGNYNNKKLINDVYEVPFISNTDIDSFEVYFTNNEVISGNNFKDTWNKYYNNYTDIENYKIGYNIMFTLNDGTVYNSNYLEPEIFKYSEHFYTYFYDDIHQEDSAFYSHLEKVDDNTLMTSVKLYAVDGIDKVNNIILTVFTYDDELDFDKEGNYRGNSKYSIIIKSR